MSKRFSARRRLRKPTRTANPSGEGNLNQPTPRSSASATATNSRVTGGRRRDGGGLVTGGGIADFSLTMTNLHVAGASCDAPRSNSNASLRGDRTPVASSRLRQTRSSRQECRSLGTATLFCSDDPRPGEPFGSEQSGLLLPVCRRHRAAAGANASQSGSAVRAPTGRGWTTLSSMVLAAGQREDPGNCEKGALG